MEIVSPLWLLTRVTENYISLAQMRRVRMIVEAEDI